MPNPVDHQDFTKKEAINKKEAKRIATRKKILETATHLFARIGYHKTTIQDIAYHIGMTTGAVFHHYSSKADILADVMAQLNHSFDQYIEYLDPPHTDHKTMIKGLVEIFLDRVLNRPDTIIALASLTVEFSGMRGPKILKTQAAYDRFVMAFEKALDRISKKKTNRAAAICFIAGLQSVALHSLVRDEEMDIEDLVEGFISLIAENR
jgi:AcrR family transcriptional regulator